MAKSIKQAFERIDELALKNANTLHKAFTVDMLTEDAIDTPVKDGFATGNWTLTSGEPDLSAKTLTDKTNNAAPTRARAILAASVAPNNTDLFISNAVEGRDEEGKLNGQGYIIQLEHGKSDQAPNGMVLRNIAQRKVIMKKTRRRVFK